MHIAVTERTPIAVIDQGDGLRALDADGVLFGHYGSRPGRMPLVTQRVRHAQEALVEGARVIESLPTCIAARVDMVEVSQRRQDPRSTLGNGRRVVWGSAEDSDQKAEVLAVLLKRPGHQIDVSVAGRRHHPLTRYRAGFRGSPVAAVTSPSSAQRGVQFPRALETAKESGGRPVPITPRAGSTPRGIFLFSGRRACVLPACCRADPYLEYTTSG